VSYTGAFRYISLSCQREASKIPPNQNTAKSPNLLPHAALQSGVLREPPLLRCGSLAIDVQHARQSPKHLWVMLSCHQHGVARRG